MCDVDFLIEHYPKIRESLNLIWNITHELAGKLLEIYGKAQFPTATKIILRSRVNGICKVIRLQIGEVGGI